MISIDILQQYMQFISLIKYNNNFYPKHLKFN